MNHVKLPGLYTDGVSVAHVKGSIYRYNPALMDHERFITYTFRFPRTTGALQIEESKFQKAFPYEVTAAEVERGVKPEKKWKTGLYTDGKVVFDVWRVSPDGVIGMQLLPQQLPYEHSTVHYSETEFRGRFFRIDAIELVEE